MELSAGKLWGYRRLGDETGRFKMTAVDQRPQIKSLIAEKRGLAGPQDAAFEDVCEFKAALAGVALLVVQSVFGGLTVIYRLPDLVSTSHLTLAFSFLILATVLASASGWSPGPRMPADAPRPGRAWGRALPMPEGSRRRGAQGLRASYGSPRRTRGPQ